MIDLDTPEPRVAGLPAAAPLDDVTVRWQPAVGRDQRPIGFRLAIDGQAAGNSLAALLDAALAGFRQDASGMPHGLVMLAPRLQGPDASLGSWGAPRNVLLEVDERMLDSADRREQVALAQKHGVRLALRVSGSAWPAADRLAPFQYLVGAAPAVAAAGRPPRVTGITTS